MKNKKLKIIIILALWAIVFYLYSTILNVEYFNGDVLLNTTINLVLSFLTVGNIFHIPKVLSWFLE